MLTLFKKIFIWWNQDTFGTRIKTIFFGKLVGTDSYGNKYYESKIGKRWVIYSNEIDATKIPVEWYSWMHFIKNRIEKNHELKKYEWQKPHKPNLTGTEAAYYPNKNKQDAIDKKYKSWKA
jgi:NADH dehydrogenase|tara:strand:- start:94 stop:456 length:363 start_codon:yes stop_codon:yes gene_type:complete